jgi:hypothetical protein
MQLKHFPKACLTSIQTAPPSTLRFFNNNIFFEIFENFNFSNKAAFAAKNK